VDLTLPWGLAVITLTIHGGLGNAGSIFARAADLDINMPHLSGIELCQIVRNDSLERITSALLTAHTDANDCEQVFAVGADDFVSKPIVDQNWSLHYQSPRANQTPTEFS